jgi:tRNA(Arg) A34 adenosine deaminase TadA
MFLLDMACDVAKRDDDKKKQFYVSCVSLRRDGACVVSVNGSSRAQPVPHAHAEARALKKSGWGAMLYVARVLRDKQTLAVAKPCVDCQSAIRNKRVKKVFFTVDNEHYGTWDVERDVWRMKRY